MNERSSGQFAIINPLFYSAQSTITAKLQSIAPVCAALEQFFGALVVAGRRDSGHDKRHACLG